MDATAESTEDGWTLVLVRELKHPPARVWTALTEPAELAAWAPFTAERALTRTGELTVTMIDGDERVELTSAVTEVDPPRLLAYRWGDDRLRWELEPTASGTRLTLRHLVGDRDDLARAAAGWHLCLDVAERLLDGDPVEPIRGRDALDHGWQQLHDGYAGRLMR
jgi:uncharacterized protein YndB with AHSA1/START domain